MEVLNPRGNRYARSGMRAGSEQQMMAVLSSVAAQIDVKMPVQVKSWVALGLAGRASKVAFILKTLVIHVLFAQIIFHYFTELKKEYLR